MNARERNGSRQSPILCAGYVPAEHVGAGSRDIDDVIATKLNILTIM